MQDAGAGAGAGRAGAPTERLIEAALVVVAEVASPRGHDVGAQLAALAGAGASVLTGLDVGARTVLATGMVLARVRAGAFGAAAELAAAETSRVADGLFGVTPADASAFWAAIAEVAVLGGDLGVAVDASRRASDAAAGHLGAQERAAGLRAVVLALEGRYGEAGRIARQAVADAPGLPTPAALCAEMVVAVARSDVLRLRANTATLARTPIPWARVMAGIAASAAGVLSGAPEQALGDGALMNGIESDSLPVLLRQLAGEWVSAAHIVRGESWRALALWQGESSTAHHVVCVEGARAVAHLGLGEPRAALRATEACLRSGPRHSRRTFPGMLLVRAVAHTRLGDAQAASLAVDEAVAIAQQVGEGTVLAPVGVASEELCDLLERCADDRPHLADTARTLASRWRRLPQLPEAAPAMPPLTRREHAVAWALRDHATVAGIATAFTVSTNTVKTQLRRLYAKIGVAGKQDALDRLEASGFFVAAGPPQE